ncbi:sulfotransferase family protein [Winogradskyella vidalii]|uniref:sulfotransferase family protein n=1 Tax=Winogradskyella vidalii TaxID=2615024 RepID=UPI0015CAE54C|nr:sulfotransferase [Winogradskyella vidalii]
MSNNFNDQPIFILGNPRSGTSLLRLMLDTHTDICIPPESHFFLWLEDKYGDWEINMLDDYLNDLFASTKFETWSFNIEKLKFYLEQKQIKSYAHLTSLIYGYYAFLKDKDIKFWGDKNSLWIEKLSAINKYYSHAFYIHIIRDGRDIACSYKELSKKHSVSKYAPKLPSEIEVIAQDWSKNIEAIELFLNNIKTENKIVIHYEDLINNTKNTLTKILRKIDLKPTIAQMEYYKKPKKEIEPEAFFDWKEKLTKPPDAKNVGKYKQELSNKEIEIFNNLAKSTLSKYHYL